jgi:hypothetical protein
MISWKWKREKIGPAEILDVASTIQAHSQLQTMKLDAGWVDARRYLGCAFNTNWRTRSWPSRPTILPICSWAPLISRLHSPPLLRSGDVRTPSRNA